MKAIVYTNSNLFSNIGAIGWTVALYSRLPILNVIQTTISSSIIVFAIALHATVDFIFVSLYYILEFPVWYVEATIVAMSSLTVIFAYMIVKKDVKSHLEDIPLQDRITSSNLMDVYM